MGDAMKRVGLDHPFRILFAALFLSGVAWCSYLIADRSPPVTDAKITIAPFTIEPAGTLHMDVVVFYRKSCTAYIKRVLYDARGQKYVLPELTLAPSGTGVQHSPTIIPMPATFASGEGRYVSAPAYGCNFFQRYFWPISMPDRSAGFYVNAPS